MLKMVRCHINRARPSIHSQKAEEPVDHNHANHHWQLVFSKSLSHKCGVVRDALAFQARKTKIGPRWRISTPSRPGEIEP
jgi:hypothetical protein